MSRERVTSVKVCGNISPKSGIVCDLRPGHFCCHSGIKYNKEWQGYLRLAWSNIDKCTSAEIVTKDEESHLLVTVHSKWVKVGE